MNKIKIFLIITGMVIILAYSGLRQYLKPDKRIAAQSVEPSSLLDLRPRLINKLQQLVKEGSGGLYNLHMKEIKADVLSSKLGIFNATIIADSAFLQQAEKNNKLPDDIYKISFDSLHIDGLGFKDLMSKNVIDLKSVTFTNPVIDIYPQKISNNRIIDTSTLYQRLLKQMKKIVIGEIIVRNGLVVSHRNGGGKPVRLNKVAVTMQNILIDSSTQFDKTRFLFAKSADISFKNFALTTADNLYLFKAATVKISATGRWVTANNLSLVPLGNKSEFIKKLKHKQIMYDVIVPHIQFTAIDWWQLFNGKGLKADEVKLSNAKIDLYMDKSVPIVQQRKDDYPQQLLYRYKMPVNIKKIQLANSKFSYEEFNPLSKQSGTVYFDRFSVIATNITNLPEVIKQNKISSAELTGLFMHKTPAKALLKFDLTKIKTGDFTAEIEMGTFDSSDVNSITKPIAMISIKRGVVNKAAATIKGNNYTASGKVLVLYNDFHVTPLKSADDGSLKKKHAVSFFANKLLIKNNNPSPGKDARNQDASFNRIPGGDLFNLIWKTMLVGILKTIGLPTSFAAPK